MSTTIDAAGRLVIPADVRREANITPGTPLDVRWRDGVIEIEPAPLSVTFARRGRLLIAKPEGRTPALTSSAVERARRAVRRTRRR